MKNKKIQHPTPPGAGPENHQWNKNQYVVDAMGIGRQSLYAAFGDKWQLWDGWDLQPGLGSGAQDVAASEGPKHGSIRFVLA